MFRFEVNYWDVNLQEPNFEKGIAAGADYNEAMKNITEFYGPDNIVDIKMYELNPVIIDDEFEIL
jgi:hypothetical protein